MKNLTKRQWVAILLAFAGLVLTLVLSKLGVWTKMAEWVKAIYDWYKAYEFITSCSK